MNKLIKATMMAASLGTMLCIVGCHEPTPVEKAEKQMAAFFALVEDCGGTISQSLKDELLRMPESKKIEIATEVENAFPKLKQCGRLLKEVNDVCRKLNEDPPVKADDMLEEFGSLVQHPQELDSVTTGIENAFPKLKRYGGLLIEANEICKKLNEEPPFKAYELWKKYLELAAHPDKLDAEIKELEEGIDYFKKVAAEKK